MISFRQARGITRITHAARSNANLLDGLISNRKRQYAKLACLQFRKRASEMLFILITCKIIACVSAIEIVAFAFACCVRTDRCFQPSVYGRNVKGIPNAFSPCCAVTLSPSVTFPLPLLFHVSRQKTRNVKIISPRISREKLYSSSKPRAPRVQISRIRHPVYK